MSHLTLVLPTTSQNAPARKCALCPNELRPQNSYICFPCQNSPHALTAGPLEVCIVEGRLHIPFDAPARYRWWQGGQSIYETLIELRASVEVLRHYTTPGTNQWPREETDPT